MNNGTIIRTVLVIATCFNTALMATDVAQFNNPKLNLVYRILSVIANFVIVFCATYFNNDYTEQGAEGTGYTRQLKAEAKGEEIVGVDVEGLDYLPEDGDEDE
jgi:hypothetical protein